jgi:uncharacterized protein YcnI
VRTTSRVIAVSLLAGAGVLALAGPAAAHVEVTADKTTAGATDVTLTFNGEAENDAAGIRSEQVVLPDGIAPAGVTLVKAPAGWTFTRNANGFTVAGKALRTGTDAEWKVKIAKLPDGETRLSFKTLETYGNGEVSRWIEIQQEGEDEPGNPAPLVTLKPGPKPAGPSAVASATVSATPGAATPGAAAPISTATAVAAEPAPDHDGGSSKWWIWVIAAVVLGAAAVLVRRRRR